MRFRVLAVLTLSAVSPSLVSAGTIRPWLAAYGSPATYSMSDVNSDISNINASLAGSGLKMDEIHSGLGFGGSFGLELPSHFSIGIGYDRMPASSEVSDASGSLKYDFPANAFRVIGQYSFASVGASGAHLGGALGLVSVAGSSTATASGSGSTKSDITGSGALFELGAGGDWWTTSQFALTSSVGYRYAKINETKVNGSTAYLANGEKAGIDYSGVVGRVGIKFALMK